MAGEGRRCWECGERVEIYEYKDGKAYCYSCLWRKQDEQSLLDEYIET